MIKQILKIAQSCASLNILAVATADGGLSLTLIPTLKEGSNPLLATPLTLKGTAEELEGGIDDALDGIHSKRVTLAETVDAAKAVLDQATKDAAEQATAKKPAKGKPQGALKSPATTSTSTSRAGADDDGEDDGEDGDENDESSASPSSTATSAPTSTSSAPAAAELNLFS